jgi:predicted metal-dependent HD superfamily phosphohydrolase
MPWTDVVAVGIRTTADGPYAEDVFWQFLFDNRCLEVPGGQVGKPELDELHLHFPGLDSLKIVRAMGSTEERIFRVWHREDSRYCPSRDELARRFRGLIGRLGGDPETAPPIFERLFTAWQADDRRYHNVEHLVDCLRELDGTNAKLPTADVVEVALWYHDVVYEPRSKDCEERSARALLDDAATLAVPLETASTAAALVRETAHTAQASHHSAGADLVVDIDLSILGRDVLRFMDYEYSIEEEYSPINTIRLRIGRGRFLAALLDRPQLFRTQHFRSRYERQARGQIAALLDSPRYRSYRWLRWLGRGSTGASPGRAEPAP